MTKKVLYKVQYCGQLYLLDTVPMLGAIYKTFVKESLYVQMDRWNLLHMIIRRNYCHLHTAFENRILAVR